MVITAVSLEAFRRAYREAKTIPSLTSRLGPRLLEPMQRRIAEVPGIPCKAGCSHCCYLRVTAFPFEVIAIYFKLVNTLGSDLLREFKSRLEARAAEVSKLTVDQHMTTNVQCPMLENGKCIVYEVRPVACAGHHSLNVEDCLASFDHPEVTDVEQGSIKMDRGVREEQARQNYLASTVLDDEREDPHQYELIASLTAVFRDPKLVQRWRDGRRVFKCPG